MANILLVEDDADLCFLTENSLKKNNHECKVAYSVKEGKAFSSETSYDLFLLDFNLPDGTGDEIGRFVRKFTFAPIIFLTGFSDDETIKDSYSCGADDFITKPVNFTLLNLKINTLLTRLASKPFRIIEDAPLYVFKHFALDVARRIIRRGGEEISLTVFEYEILRYLIRHTDTLVLYSDLYRSVWQNDDTDDIRTVAVHVSNLRKKIDPSPGIGIITTVRGVGYIFSDK
ncbi:DNA-binding response regulator [Clostridia bacterium]|nr:DNA-binding response regulator [Clostridia bacterium]